MTARRARLTRRPRIGRPGASLPDRRAPRRRVASTAAAAALFTRRRHAIATNLFLGLLERHEHEASRVRQQRHEPLLLLACGRRLICKPARFCSSLLEVALQLSHTPALRVVVFTLAVLLCAVAVDGWQGCTAPKVFGPKIGINGRLLRQLDSVCIASSRSEAVEKQTNGLLLRAIFLCHLNLSLVEYLHAQPQLLFRRDEIFVLRNEFHCLCRHLRELRINGNVLLDGPLRRLGHLLVGDVAKVGNDFVDLLQHFLLQPILILHRFTLKIINNARVLSLSFLQLNLKRRRPCLVLFFVVPKLAQFVQLLPKEIRLQGELVCLFFRLCRQRRQLQLVSIPFRILLRLKLHNLLLQCGDFAVLPRQLRVEILNNVPLISRLFLARLAQLTVLRLQFLASRPQLKDARLKILNLNCVELFRELCYVGWQRYVGQRFLWLP
eukprot:Opistho-2@69370